VRRLHLKLYLAIVGTMVVFLIAGTVVWHHLVAPSMAMGGIESATQLAAEMLDKGDHDPAREREVVVALSRQLHAQVELYDAQGSGLVSFGGHALELTREELADRGWLISRTGPALNQLLEDGRHLTVRPRQRYLLHGLHFGILFISIAAVLALLTYPITRGITARLARLQSGVLQFGAGNLSARVKVEGRDEVASLAKSFNESAERIEQLMRAHRLLIANCSHELRTPLARIRLGLDRVSGTDAKASDEIARSIAELDALIGEMLLSSRLDVAQGIERAEPVDLLALAAEEAAHFDLEVSGDAVTINADPMLLRRLVRNLLENARVHGGGATGIRVERAGRHAHIVVEDGGAGVPGSDRERIFEPFFRASTATQSSGAGLGLSIVRQIARAHGGTVEYAPREGGGSRFVVTLPNLSVR
jgi:signal transduction histidine kinase